MQGSGSGLLKPEVIDPFIGTLFEGKYRIESKIGEGGMGAVYRATHIFMERPVAIKFLHGDRLTDPAAVERFKREARAAGRIQHPNATAVTDFGVTSDNTFYLVMEYLEGRTLRDRLRAEGPLSCEETVRIMSQVCEAVDVAHKREIIHRDLKPDNIFLQLEGDAEVVKVLDFGIAKLTHSSSATAGLTSAGMIVGTPYYMSPEQCQGDTLDPGADIYSLGVIVFEMLTGKLPFTGESPLSIVLKHVSEMPPSPRQLRPDLPEAVEAVIMRALAKRTQDRQPSALAFAEELGQAIGVKIMHRTTGAYAPIMKTDAFTPEAGETTGDNLAQGKANTPASTSKLQTRPIAAVTPTVAHGALVGAQLKDAVAKKGGAVRSGVTDSETLEAEAVRHASGEIVTTGKSRMPVYAGAAALLILIGAVAVWKFVISKPVAPPQENQQQQQTQTSASDNMVSIPGGAFTMGREPGTDEFGKEVLPDQTPARKVVVKPFYIGKYEVTNKEYKEFVFKANYPAPPDWVDNSYRESQADLPVGNVNWNDANAYCEWRSKKEGRHYRLPTEEEWEFSARGTESLLYPWGPTFEVNRANTKEVAGAPLAVTSESLAKDKSPFDIIGMAGNVSEWASDDYKPYPGYKGETLRSNPGDKVARGSNYINPKYTATGTFRGPVPPEFKNPALGFRIATSDPPK